MFSHRQLDVYPVQCVAAELGLIEDKVVVGGVFIFPNQYSLRFRHRAGPLRGIYARYGEPVTEGQLVAELDTDNLLIDIERQRIMVRKAQLDLERLRASLTASGEVGATAIAGRVLHIDSPFCCPSNSFPQIVVKRFVRFLFQFGVGEFNG